MLCFRSYNINFATLWLMCCLMRIWVLIPLSEPSNHPPIYFLFICFIEKLFERIVSISCFWAFFLWILANVRFGIPPKHWIFLSAGHQWPWNASTLWSFLSIHFTWPTYRIIHNQLTASSWNTFVSFGFWETTHSMPSQVFSPPLVLVYLSNLCVLEGPGFPLRFLFTLALLVSLPRSVAIALNCIYTYDRPMCNLAQNSLLKL